MLGRAGLTGRRVVRRHISGILSKNDGEPGLEMEVDVAVEEPRAGVVGREANGDVVARRASGDDVALGRVDIVVRVTARAAHDPELVLYE